jgi:hypothetical protein
LKLIWNLITLPSSYIFSKARIDFSGIALFMSPTTVLNFNVDTNDYLKVLRTD